MRTILLLLALAATVAATLYSADLPFEVHDLSIGDTATAQGAALKLLRVEETRDPIVNAIRRAQASISIDGVTATLECGNYNLPRTVGKVQVDCSVTGGYRKGEAVDPWKLQKDARIRVWPAGVPWLPKGAWKYPVRQRWFATATQIGNEPTYIDGGDVATRKQIYYHTGLDIGGAEGFTPVVAATDGLIVSLAGAKMPEHTAPVIAPRYDVIYLLDSRGWYYRYSHFHSLDPTLKLGGRVIQGQRLGLLGKEGGSGGWTHLHFEPHMQFPNGQWGSLDGFAFLLQAYQTDFPTPLVIAARPHKFVRAGEPVTLTAHVLSGTPAKPVPEVTRTYSKPGTYSELFEVADASGYVARDSAIVSVLDAAKPESPYISLHASYYPSLDAHAGQPITFQARSFLMRYVPIPKTPSEIEERWDFGDGVTGVSHSDGNAVKLAPNGYGRIQHTYTKPGRYLVRVESTAPDGAQARMYLDVIVDK